MTKYNLPLLIQQLPEPFDLSTVQLPLTGEMAQYIGTQYTGEEIYDEDYYSPEDIAKLKGVRAYSIPKLVGKKIGIQHQNQLGAKMYTLIQETLPDIEWEPFEISTAPFRKYFIVHFELSAPPDLTTGQAMGLEVFGQLLKVNGEEIASPSGQTWVEEQQRLLFEADMARQEWSELVGDFEIEIKTATYSNIRYPGVGVPLYL